MKCLPVLTLGGKGVAVIVRTSHPAFADQHRLENES